MLTVEKTTGERHPLLDYEVPSALMYLFEVFADLSGGRVNGLGGMEPIAQAQLYYWQLNNYPLRRWEVKALQAADRAYIKVQGKDYQGPEDDNDDVN